MTVLPADFFESEPEAERATTAETVAAAEGFAASGNKLTNLGFTDNRFQRLGNDGYLLWLHAHDHGQAGTSNTVSGRATKSSCAPVRPGSTRAGTWIRAAEERRRPAFRRRGRRGVAANRTWIEVREQLGRGLAVFAVAKLLEGLAVAHL
jgi:hypothetical protein